MSNFLAIATVTATLQRIIQAAIQIDVPGSRVTTVRPEASKTGAPEVGVNVYLYQATPNPTWRNHDLRTRRPKGELVKRAQAGLDLYYIMTFYGNETELEPQRLLGSAVRTIVDYPIMTPEMIQDTLDNPTFSFLAGSTLGQQVERVTMIPSMVNTEELSKIWSVFFQTPYILSFPLEGSAVLIEGNKTSGRALPVRRTDFYTTPYQPVISQVLSEAGSRQPIVANSTVLIRGQQLQGESASQTQSDPTLSMREAVRWESPENVRDSEALLLSADRIQIRIGDAKLTSQTISDQEIRLDLSSLPPEEKQSLRPGVQSLQVLYPVPRRERFEPERVIGSNVVPFILCPTITEIQIQQLDDNTDGYYSTQIGIQVDLTVDSKQRVLLFLNERASNPAAYIFIAELRSEDANLIVFPINDVKGGEYLVRVQIDGAESPLEVDTNPNSDRFEQYIHPIVVIG